MPPEMYQVIFPTFTFRAPHTLDYGPAERVSAVNIKSEQAHMRILRSLVTYESRLDTLERLSKETALPELR
jgi:hypothetical protein